MTPLVIHGDNLASVEMDYEEVHNVSVGILQALEANHVPLNVGVAGAALTMGRLLSPVPMDEDEEMNLVNDLMEWIGVYFAKEMN